jgi:hypothetical protein
MYGTMISFAYSEKIIAEAKNEQIGITDIIQTKVYAEVFDATYSFLVSSQPIPEEIKRRQQTNARRNSEGGLCHCEAG